MNDPLLLISVNTSLNKTDRPFCRFFSPVYPKIIKKRILKIRYALVRIVLIVRGSWRGGGIYLGVLVVQ